MTSMRLIVCMTSALVAPASGASITTYEPVTVTSHYSAPRNCCPSRYSALTNWGQHKRCGFHRDRGGTGGGAGGGIIGGTGYQGGGLHGFVGVTAAGGGAGAGGGVP